MKPFLTSPSNPQIKELKKLFKSSKERRESNQYIAEGIHLVQSFLATGQVPSMYVYSVKSRENPEVAEILDKLETATTQEIVVSDNLFDSLSAVDAKSGIFIVFSPPKPNITQILPLTETTILLENVQDPGNLGTILRTAAAVGIKNLLLSSGCTSAWSPKALRAGMGAQFSLSIYEDTDLLNVINTSSIPTIATLLSEESVSLYKTNLNRPLAWLFGSEGQGVSETLTSAASIKATIPQKSGTVESLNVAAATAVCLYEQYRQKLSH